MLFFGPPLCNLIFMLLGLLMFFYGPPLCNSETLLTPIFMLLILFMLFLFYYVIDIVIGLLNVLFSAITHTNLDLSVIAVSSTDCDDILSSAGGKEMIMMISCSQLEEGATTQDLARAQVSAGDATMTRLWEHVKQAS